MLRAWLGLSHEARFLHLQKHRGRRLPASVFYNRCGFHGFLPQTSISPEIMSQFLPTIFEPNPWYGTVRKGVGMYRNVNSADQNLSESY